MKKNIWIMNHYATNMFFSEAGRHYYFAKNLIDKMYKPTIFCASTLHTTYDNLEIGSNGYERKISNEIPFVFVKTLLYNKNNYKRILNILSFYKNLQSVAMKYAEKYGKPDIILASSVHPLTLKAGLKIAEKFEIPCITEIRDLWPESLVAYDIISEKNPLTKLLYKDEKRIYEKSDSIIMTWEGGGKYIVDQGWDKTIDLDKVYHISNGIILEDFDRNSERFIHEDEDLNDDNYQNIVYTGSIRKVNNLGLILDVAKIIKFKNKNIRFLIYGEGEELEILKEQSINENIDNVIFKGRVEKKYIPSILKKSYANLLHNSSTSLNKYGQSQNKLFEYLAAGKPVIQTYETGFSLLDRYDAGISSKNQNPQTVADTIIKLCNNKKRATEMGLNAREASRDFDFEILTKKLISVIEKVETVKK